MTFISQLMNLPGVQTFLGSALTVTVAFSILAGAYFTYRYDSNNEKKRLAGKGSSNAATPLDFGPFVAKHAGCVGRPNQFSRFVTIGLWLTQLYNEWTSESPRISLWLNWAREFALKVFGISTFAIRGFFLHRMATSRQQFFYLVQKMLVGIPIRKGESIVKSYLDAKRAMGEIFPFMWEVNHVKDKKIICDGYECVPMSSYSYLDLVRSDDVQEAAIVAAREYSSGNHGPRMLGGNMKILVDLEKQLSEFYGREGCLLAATGFLACMSISCAVAQKGDVIFYDSRAHASLQSGMKICGAKTYIFKHNNFAHAASLMKKHRSKFNNAWMIVESVYSMDGDVLDLPAAKKVCDEFDTKMIIDEAHGIGVLGPTGRGVEEVYGMQGTATFIVGTFSKSCASIGGFIVGDKDWMDYMDFHAPGNVFSAPLPAYSAGAAIKSLELIDKEPWRLQKAQENSKYLRAALETGLGQWPENYPEENKYELEGDERTTVIPVVLKDDMERLVLVANAMKTSGFMCSAVAFPACPLRRPRFRITATTAYDKETMDRFVKTLVKACVDTPPSPMRAEMGKLPL